MSDKGSPYRVGTKVFVRTVTHYYTGRVLASDHLELLLEDQAARFAEPLVIVHDEDNRAGIARRFE